MIDQISVHNFRRLRNFSLRLQHGNILVGPNNAGKSSLLDALRLLDACYRQTRTQNPRPMSIKDGGTYYGYEIGANSLPFALANVTINYSDSDAVIEFRFNTKVRAVILLHPDRSTRFYIDAPGGTPNTSSKFRKMLGVDIVIVPTLAPLEADENYVADETVRRNSTTRLASRVLRNIWLREDVQEFNSFRADVESAWPGVEIFKPELVRNMPPTVQMFYAEDRMQREVQWSGFGFQVWLQIQSHLRRGTKDSILVIDEPDIYLHPDLQRRLLDQIRKRFSQFVMATHSTEMVNDAEPNEIVSINSKYRNGKRINSEEEFFSLYKYLGTKDNADFARIARAKRVIFVEGRDGKLIRRFAKKLGLDSLANPQGPPIIQLGFFKFSASSACYLGIQGDIGFGS